MRQSYPLPTALSARGYRETVQPVTAAVSAASLVVGFGVADATGVRALGGAVLVAGGAWCARKWWRSGGSRVAGLLVGAGLVAFAAAHVLALGFGMPAYPAVFLVAGVDAAIVLTISPSGRLATHRAVRPVSGVPVVTAGRG